MIEGSAVFIGIGLIMAVLAWIISNRTSRFALVLDMVFLFGIMTIGSATVTFIIWSLFGASAC